ncbi:hypothetical protein [Nocardia rhamnosiphila]
MSPTVVAIYDLGFPEPRKVAELRLAAEGAVALTVIDPDGCLVAERWQERGVKVYDPLRVRPIQGAPFLRALLDLPAMSYYRVVDEKSPPARGLPQPPQP